MLLRQKETSLELLTRRHDQLQARHEEIVGELEKRLDIAKDKEMQLIRVSSCVAFMVVSTLAGCR